MSASNNEDESFVQLDINQALSALAAFMRRMFSYYLILPIVFVFVCIGMLLMYACTSPVYTATAMIGPPNPSPINSMLSSMGTGSSGLASKVLGGRGGGGNDPFSEFLHMLQSPRLASELAEKDGALQVVYSGRWDSAKKQWQAPGMMFGIKTALAGLMHRSVRPNPGTEDLLKHIDTRFSIETIKPVGGSVVTSIALSSSSYYLVSYISDSPEKAERLLGMILSRADEIIRQEQLADVTSRIAYINNELPHITQSEQKTALIQTLANQDEIKVMIVADKRFAHVQISTPYASPVPTKPMGPMSAFAYSIILSLLIWAGLVALEGKLVWLGRLMAPLWRGERA